MWPESGSETVLVVDDEISVISLAHAMLRRYGYTVIAANSAREALRLVEVWPGLEIDLAILDIVMSGIDGFELAERLRKRIPGLPILYMSAYSEKEDMRPDTTADVPFLAKPFTAAQLAKKVRFILDAQRKVISAAS
jgi:CheY-like chemotaxis protein